MKITKGKIANALESVAEDHVVAVADDIYDEAIGDYQSNINQRIGSGKADLDENGKVPSSQLPSYVDDVVEAESKTAFPSTGESGKIYIALDTNKTYRWGGTEYVEISSSLALGETASSAYRGDRGKIAYEHSQSLHAPSNAQENVIEEVKVNGTPLVITDKSVDISLAGKEDSSNKVSSWSASPTDEAYPTEKLVKDTIESLKLDLNRKKNRPSGLVDTSAIELHNLYVGDTSGNINPFRTPTIGDWIPVVRAFSAQQGQINVAGRIVLNYYRAGYSMPNNFPSLEVYFRFTCGEKGKVSLYLTDFFFDNKGDETITFDPKTDLTLVRIDKGLESNTYSRMQYFQRYEYVLLIRYKFQYSKFTVYEDYRQIDADSFGGSDYFARMIMWCTNMPLGLTTAQKDNTWDKTIELTDDPRDRNIEWWSSYMSRPDFRECFVNTTTTVEAFKTKYGESNVDEIPCVWTSEIDKVESRVLAIETDLTNYLNKTSKNLNILKGNLQVGTNSGQDSIANAFLHIRNVGASSVTGKAVNGAGFAVNGDGTTAFQHKVYNDNGTGAKNDSILRFSKATGLQFAINTGSGNTPTEDMFKLVAMVEDITEGENITISKVNGKITISANIDTSKLATLQALNDGLSAKQDTLTEANAGNGISIENGVISATGGSSEDCWKHTDALKDAIYSDTPASAVNWDVITSNEYYIAQSDNYSIKVQIDDRTKVIILFNEDDSIMYGYADTDDEDFSRKANTWYYVDNINGKLIERVPNVDNSSFEVLDATYFNEYLKTFNEPKRTIAEKLATKQDTLIAGEGITIENGVISSNGGEGTEYSEGYGISISDNTISAEVEYRNAEYSDDDARNRLGGDWRIPTKEEFEELLQQCDWEWTSLGDMNGYSVKSRVNSNSIFLPVHGYRDGFNNINRASGYYWSSVVNTDDVNTAYVLTFNENGISMDTMPRYLGCYIRPVSNSQGIDLGLSVRWSELDLDSSDVTEQGFPRSWGGVGIQPIFEWIYYRLGRENSITKYNASDGLTVLSNDVTDKGYITSHGDELQTKLKAGDNIIIQGDTISAVGGTEYSAGDSISIEEDVISYTPKMVEIKLDEDGNKGGYLGAEFFNRCVENPALLMDAIFYECEDSEDEESKNIDHEYTKPSWVSYVKSERMGEVEACHFIITTYYLGDFRFFPDGRVEPFGW